jgi:hypothetical protein
MWTPEEKERQRVLDALALRTGKADDWLAADSHFVNTDRKYDRLRAVDPYADLLVDIITTAAEAHRQAGDRDIRFERRRVDETAHKRWSRATDAREFFKSDTFLQFMELFGMKADSVFGRVQAL